MTAITKRSTLEYVGFALSGDVEAEMWTVTCPCGIVVTYGINKLPTVNTPHPCGKANHWTVKRNA